MDDFYVEDEPAEDVQRAWESGEPVLVIPYGLRRRFVRRVRKLWNAATRIRLPSGSGVRR
jgi:hypothetical protein